MLSELRAAYECYEQKPCSAVKIHESMGNDQDLKRIVQKLGICEGVEVSGGHFIAAHRPFPRISTDEQKRMFLFYIVNCSAETVVGCEQSLHEENKELFKDLMENPGRKVDEEFYLIDCYFGHRLDTACNQTALPAIFNWENGRLVTKDYLVYAARNHIVIPKSSGTGTVGAGVHCTPKIYPVGSNAIAEPTDF